jgi:serine/threonine protein kinase
MATNYVGTRWYRAPELLRPDSTITDTGDGDDDNNINDYKNYPGSCYTTANDVFSMGCVAAELYLCHPLFRGKDEKEQLALIKELLLVTRPPFVGGNIAHEVFSEKDDEQRKETIVKNWLEDTIPTTNPLDITFPHDILQIYPEQRATTEEVLCHAYFEREYKATMRNENDESPILKSITRAKTKRRSSVLALPKLTVTASSNKTAIGEPRKRLSPSAATSTPTTNTTIQFHQSPPHQ